MYNELLGKISGNIRYNHNYTVGYDKLHIHVLFRRAVIVNVGIGVAGSNSISGSPLYITAALSLTSFPVYQMQLL